MKLRNKKTGGIDDFKIEETDLKRLGYTSLKEFCEEWEDVSTKEAWYLGERIGNYSMSKKEAREATKKILAWKRLKDKGFRFNGWNVCDNGKGIIIFANYPSETKEDLDLLFGGEE